MALNSTEGEPYTYTIISRVKNEDGWPIYNRHTLEESTQTEEQAVVYAKHRAKCGYWVTVHKDLWYDTGEDNEIASGH